MRLKILPVYRFYISGTQQAHLSQITTLQAAKNTYIIPQIGCLEFSLHKSFTINCIFIAAEMHSSQLSLLTTPFPACSFTPLPFVVLQSHTILKGAKN